MCLSSPTDGPLEISAVGVVRLAIRLTPRLQFGTKGACFYRPEESHTTSGQSFVLQERFLSDRLSGSLSLKMVANQTPNRSMRAAYIAKVGLKSPGERNGSMLI